MPWGKVVKTSEQSSLKYSEACGPVGYRSHFKSTFGLVDPEDVFEKLSTIYCGEGSMPDISHAHPATNESAVTMPCSRCSAPYVYPSFLF